MATLATQPNPPTGTASGYSTGMVNNLAQFRLNDQALEDRLEATNEAIYGNGVITGSYTAPILSAGTGLTANVAALSALIGFVFDFAAGVIAVPASSTSHIFLFQDGTLGSNTTGTNPGTTTNPAIELGTVVTSGSGVTSATDTASLISFPGLSSPGNNMLLRTNGTGQAAATTIGTGLSFDGTTLSSTAGGEAVGTMKAWPGVASTYPGVGTWFSCDGAAKSRTTYPDLWAIAQANFTATGSYAPFGPGDGSTTFNLPDSRDKVLVGAGSSYTLGQTTGATTASTGASNTGSSTDTFTTGNNSNSSGTQTVSNGVVSFDQGTGAVVSAAAVSGSQFLIPSHTHTGTTAGHTHSTPNYTVSTIQPSLAVNHIIRAL